MRVSNIILSGLVIGAVTARGGGSNKKDGDVALTVVFSLIGGIFTGIGCIVCARAAYQYGFRRWNLETQATISSQEPEPNTTNQQATEGLSLYTKEAHSKEAHFISHHYNHASCSDFQLNGGRYWNRTSDLLHVKQAL